MRIILASASPRRRELLGKIGLEFEVISSDGEELITRTDPSGVAMELARQKAEAVAGMLVSGQTAGETDPACDVDYIGDSDISEPVVRDGSLLIIGSDTIVAHQDRILGKPRDEEDAFRMLSALSGETHFVYTGVCLYMPNDHVYTFYEETAVEFYPMSDEEIRAYIATGDPMDKAGAYGIQSGAGIYIRGIKGDYDNVVGLPVARLYHEMKRLGISLGGK